MVLEATDDKISFFKQYFSVIILIANIAVFVWQMMDPTGLMRIDYAFKPAEFFAGQKLWTIFTSMFMHGDIMHIVMNMWFFLVITNIFRLWHICYFTSRLEHGFYSSVGSYNSSIHPFIRSVRSDF